MRQEQCLNTFLGVLERLHHLILAEQLIPAHQMQTHLFDQHDRTRSQRLMAALDAINTQWGSWNRTLYGRGIATRLDHALCPTLTSLYDAMGGVGRGMV